MATKTVPILNQNIIQVMRKARYWIGIDPGVNTGFAIWDRKDQSLLVVKSLPIHEAMTTISNLAKPNEYGSDIFVRFEDARQRNWFGHTGREQLQGAGSIKRDCTIWKDFLTSSEIPFEMVPPRRNKTKTTAEYFARLTGWKDKTNEHSRDAAMLVYGR